MSYGLLLINIANQRMTKANGENSTNISKLFEIFLLLLNQNLVFFLWLYLRPGVYFNKKH